MKFRLSSLFLGLILVFSCNSEPEELTLYVSGKTIQCENSQAQCLRIKTDLNEDWSIYSGKIAGFTHQKDQDFTIKVKPLQKENDGGLNGDYELVEIINQNQSPIELGEGSWNVFFVLESDTFDRQPFLTISEDLKSIHGSTSCNKFKSSLDATGGSFSLGNIALTKMACPKPELETNFLKQLNKVSTYEILDNTLHLLAEDSTILLKAAHIRVRQ